MLYTVSMGAFWNEWHTSGGLGQCHHFFVPHHLIVLSFLGILWGEVIPASQHPQAWWGSPWAILLEACGWQPEGIGLLVGQPLGMDIAHVFVFGAVERSKFSPPFWHSFMLL